MAYALGAVVSYEGFAVAASWGDWGDSDLPVGTDGDQTYWTAGVSYATGPYGFSFNTLQSTVAYGATENEFTNYSFGADFALAPGLTPYLELVLFDLDEGGTTVDNEGTLVMTGVQLNF